MNGINFWQQAIRVSQIGLSATVLLVSTQIQTIAQTTISADVGETGVADQAPRPLARALSPSIALPDLPPIEPIFPEIIETRLVLRLSSRRVYVYQGEEVQASYPVAIGRRGWETPTGTFEVFQMVEHPGWTNPFTREVVPPGPENPLGERWIGFWTDDRNFIGFHGTPNRESVGRAASHGCVRMFNEDIRELYEIVAIGTPVIVEP